MKLKNTIGLIFAVSILQACSSGGVSTPETEAANGNPPEQQAALPAAQTPLPPTTDVAEPAAITSAAIDTDLPVETVPATINSAEIDTSVITVPPVITDPPVVGVDALTSTDTTVVTDTPSIIDTPDIVVEPAIPHDDSVSITSTEWGNRSTSGMAEHTVTLEINRLPSDIITQAFTINLSITGNAIFASSQVGFQDENYADLEQASLACDFTNQGQTELTCTALAQSNCILYEEIRYSSLECTEHVLFPHTLMVEAEDGEQVQITANLIPSEFDTQLANNTDSTSLVSKVPAVDHSVIAPDDVIGLANEDQSLTVDLGVSKVNNSNPIFTAQIPNGVNVTAASVNNGYWTHKQEAFYGTIWPSVVHESSTSCEINSSVISCALANNEHPTLDRRTKFILDFYGQTDPQSEFLWELSSDVTDSAPDDNTGSTQLLTSTVVNTDAPAVTEPPTITDTPDVVVEPTVPHDDWVSIISTEWGNRSVSGMAEHTITLQVDRQPSEIITQAFTINLSITGNAIFASNQVGFQNENYDDLEQGSLACDFTNPDQTQLTCSGQAQSNCTLYEEVRYSSLECIEHVLFPHTLTVEAEEGELVEITANLIPSEFDSQLDNNTASTSLIAKVPPVDHSLVAPDDVTGLASENQSFTVDLSVSKVNNTNPIFTAQIPEGVNVTAASVNNGYWTYIQYVFYGTIEPSLVHESNTSCEINGSIVTCALANDEHPTLDRRTKFAIEFYGQTAESAEFLWEINSDVTDSAPGDNTGSTLSTVY